MGNPHINRARRRFFKITCSAAVAVAGAGCGSPVPPDIGHIGRYLAGLLRHPEAAAKLGGRYIHADPSVGGLSPEQITLLILEHAGMDAPGASLAEIGQSVKARVRRDFVDEDVLVVEGWLLARTEVLLCALVYLRRDVDS